MQSLIIFALRHPWLMVLGVATLTVVATLRLPDLEFHVAAQGMMVEDDPDRTFYDSMHETFGSGNASVVYLADPSLFTPAKLAHVGAVVKAIEALPYVSHITSLFSVRNIKTVDGFVSMEPYLRRIPQTVAEAEEIKQNALENPMVVGNLLSLDGESMALNVYFADLPADAELDQRASKDIAQILQSELSDFSDFFFIGTPQIRVAVTERIHTDQQLILPLSLLVLMASLVLILRRLNAAIIPLVTATLSVVWTLGLMAAVGIPVNVMTSIMPALLIIIGSTEDIHLLAEYQFGIDRGLGRQASVFSMADNMGMAILLTFVTTYLGFLSISLNNLGILQQFGLVASTGLLLNFLITLTVIPVMLRWFGEKPGTRKQKEKSQTRFHRIVSGLYTRVSAHKTLVSLALLGITAGCLYGTTGLRVNNNPMSYFPDDSPVLKAANTLHEELSGMRTLSIVVSGTAGTFLRLQYLEELQSLQDFIEEETRFDKTLSFADFMRVINHGLDEEYADEGYYLPDADEIVREYMSFISHDHVRSFVSGDYGQARILVRHNIGSTWELQQEVARIQRYIDESFDSDLDVRFTGEAWLNAQAADYMAGGQILSLVLMLIVIFLIISILFFNFKAGLLAVVANLFPISVLFGVMGYAGIALDTGTVMIGAISLGICVDHTMHFMVRYQRKLRVLGDEVLALRETVTDEALPIIATAVALAAGFGAMSLSSFPPVAAFGSLSAMVMLLALVSTFVILPMLLGSIQLITVWDVLALKLRGPVIKRCPLFIGMGAWQIKRVVLASHIHDYQAGDRIIHQGEQGAEMYVILDGHAEVWQNQSDGSRSRIKALAAGDVFGEIALISESHRTADVVATQHTEVLVFHWDHIHRIARLFPRIAARLFRNISMIVGKRLVDTETDGSNMRDDLTGAYNRTWFGGLLQFAVDKARRYDEPMALVFIGIHHFAELESRQSVAASEHALIVLAREIERLTRNSDILSRWSSDRFALLLPRTLLHDARDIMLRLTNACADQHVGDTGPLSIGCGIAGLRPDDDISQLIERAQAHQQQAMRSETGVVTD